MRYYLNNMTDEAIQITLTTHRIIYAKSSLPLNNKDVEIFKKLKRARKGKASQLDSLRLSKIRIEEDTNYTEKDALIAKASKESFNVVEDNQEVLTEDNQEVLTEDNQEVLTEKPKRHRRNK